MTDERDLDVIEELGALLDAAPSAAFAAHVRNAIEREGPGRFSWRLVTVAGLGVAAAALALGIAARRRAPVALSAARVVSNVLAPVTRAPASVAPTPSASPARREPASKLRTRRAAEEVVDLAPVVTTVDGHDVIVPADQRLALARLMSGVRAGRFSVPAEMSPKYDADGLLLPIAPVVISAIPDPIPAPIDSPAPQGDRNRSQKERR